MHQAIAGGVQASHLFGRQVVVEVYNLRGVRLSLGLLDDFGKGLARIKSFAPEILDDQANIVAGREGFEVCVLKNVRPFAPDRPAHK